MTEVNYLVSGPKNADGTPKTAIDAQEAYAGETRNWDLMDRVIALKHASKAASKAKLVLNALPKMIEDAEAKLESLRERQENFDDADVQAAQDALVLEKNVFRTYIMETQMHV